MYGTARSKLDTTVYTRNTAYLITGLQEFTQYFVQVQADTSVSGAPSNIEQAKTHEDCKLLDSIFLLDCSDQMFLMSRRKLHG